MNRGLGSVRTRLVAIASLALAWAVARAGVSEVVNVNGWPAFARFWSSVVDPETSAEFLRLTYEATLTTAAFAVLGATGAIVIGLFGSLLMTELVVSSDGLRRVSTAIAAVPRSVHEILIALLLVQVFGFDPIVAVLAIAVPFGAVTAKVFADLFDDADRVGYDALRASGAGRLGALVYGVGPNVRPELASYGFYRFECAIRSAAVLGIVGVGGLGFQLDLSFESLRYAEIWTLIVALMVLSGLADALSSVVRHRRLRTVPRRLRPPPIAWVIALGAALGWAWWQVGLDLSSLWSARTRERAASFGSELLRPRLGPGGWSELGAAIVDTVALSILATVIAVVVGLIGAASIRRRSVGVNAALAPVRRGTGRTVLLLFRAVPAPVWAFLFVLVLYPGLWPGAVALGVYNAGVLGRLFAEAIESQLDDAERAVLLAGGGGAVAWAYGVLPASAPRLVSLTVYRAEVIVRETIVIGVVGAGGLGQLIRDHLVARDFAAVSGVVIVLIVLASAADALGHVVRRTLR